MRGVAAAGTRSHQCASGSCALPTHPIARHRTPVRAAHAGARAALHPQAPQQAAGQHRRADEHAHHHQRQQQGDAQQAHRNAQQRMARAARRVEGEAAETQEGAAVEARHRSGNPERDSVMTQFGEVSAEPAGQVVSSSLNETARAGCRWTGLPPDSLHACDAPVDGESESLILLSRRRAACAPGSTSARTPAAGWTGRPGKFLRSKDGELVCAVHGATLRAAAGQCVAGPCRGECLRAVAVDVRDGASAAGGSRADPARAAGHGPAQNIRFTISTMIAV